MKKMGLLLGTTLLIVAGVGVALVARHRGQLTPALALELLPNSALHVGTTRPVYPYSVIPGGAYNSTEVSSYVAVDPVAREHYKDIHSEALQTARTAKPMLMYVSYRKGSQIGWTRHKVSIPKGELVLTDGKNVIRARCGNRMRALPPPLASEVLKGEPPNTMFETPLAESISTSPPTTSPTILATLEPSVDPTSTGEPLPEHSMMPVASPGASSHAAPIYGPISSNRGNPPGNSDNPHGNGDNPHGNGDNPHGNNRVPEPSTLLLVASGGLGGAIWRLARHRLK